MDTIQSLMAAGNDVFSRQIMPTEPDWQGEYSATPDDAYPEEDRGQSVAAADAGTEPLTVDKLSDAVLEGLTGVTREWLGPVRSVFERLAALAMSKHVTDDDFIAALERAQREMPELFELLDSQALEMAFENAIGTAALAGSVSRYE